jgi:uncharacterized protein with FMN-binding domain
MARLVRHPRDPSTMKKIALSLLVIATSGTYVWYQSGRQGADTLLASLPQNTDTQAAAIEPRVATPAVVEPGATAQSAPLVMRDSTTNTALPVSPPDEAPRLPTAPGMTAVAVSPLAPSTDAGATGAIVADASPSSASPQVSPAVNVPLPRLRPTHRATRANSTPPTVSVAVKTSRYIDGTFTGPVTDAYYGLVQIQAIVQGGRLAGIKVLQYPSDRRTSVAINHQALPMLRSEVVAAQGAKVDIISGATLTSEAFIKSLGGALRQAAS